MAGVGIYWCLVELLHEGCGEIENDLETLSFQLQADEQIIKDVIDICFSVKDDMIFCERVIENLQFREASRLQKSAAGTAGALARWGSKDTPIDVLKQSDNNRITLLSQKYNIVMAENGKEKEKEKEKEKDKVKGKVKDKDKALKATILAEINKIYNSDDNDVIVLALENLYRYNEEVPKWGKIAEILDYSESQIESFKQLISNKLKTEVI